MLVQISPTLHCNKEKHNYFYSCRPPPPTENDFCATRRQELKLIWAKLFAWRRFEQFVLWSDVPAALLLNRWTNNHQRKKFVGNYTNEAAEGHLHQGGNVCWWKKSCLVCYFTPNVCLRRCQWEMAPIKLLIISVMRRKLKRGLSTSKYNTGFLLFDEKWISTEEWGNITDASLTAQMEENFQASGRGSAQNNNFIQNS